MFELRKKDKLVVDMILAVRPGGLHISLMQVGNPTIESMIRRRVIVRHGDRFKLHPRAERALVAPKLKEQRRQEFEDMRLKMSQSGCRVNVSGKKSTGLTVSVLTSGGRRYTATGCNMVEAAKEVFALKDQHEAIKAELSLWRNSPDC